jgi:UDP-N-acetylglucosamine 1-carboxyvinyltransferase
MVLRGGRPLEGSVSLRGAKNSLPKLMVAALLTGEPCRFATSPISSTLPSSAI